MVGLFEVWGWSFLINFGMAAVWICAVAIIMGTMDEDNSGLGLLLCIVSFMMALVTSFPQGGRVTRFDLPNRLWRRLGQLRQSVLQVVHGAEQLAQRDDHCDGLKAELVAITTPGAQFLGQVALNASVSNFWTGLSTGTGGGVTTASTQAKWVYPSLLPSAYRPWKKAQDEHEAGCASASLDGFQVNSCTNTMPFMCQRAIMPYIAEANCWKSPGPTISPKRWNDDIEWIRFTDPDWTIDRTSVKMQVLVAEGKRYTFCAAPVKLKTVTDAGRYYKSPVADHCEGIIPVAICYSTTGDCGAAAQQNCGWNYRPGGFAQVYRSRSVYAMMESEEYGQYTTAAKLFPASDRGYKRLFINWVSEYTPYTMQSELQSQTTSCMVQW
eukprot:CAMPEP_0174340700 /NCGR_PEP_ID=MMETSP0810-20121108/24845_1 /TAXON_ID=73025 ORGANISM="Eutreptiella gymnastica-like, Strain CCMP1594" /NCGR_SAMPLE_ID=MMETSP0810 /ASSEMBLY_ACC=CAM_ASM_000659 /LENGTH=381 /DNA_ID=CAMNT_0015461941 /DNA_START=1 /DNA_END=1145 /DNA_ORIENTATION=-